MGWLDLGNNAFSATGWDLLAEVVGRKGAMPNLKQISAYGNKDEPSAKLREACEKRGVVLYGGDSKTKGARDASNSELA